MDRRFFLTLMAFTFTVFLCFVIYKILSPFLIPLAWAMIIGISTFPLFIRLRCLINCRETTAAAIMTALASLTLILPVVGLVYLLTQEVIATYHFVERLTQQGEQDVVHAILAHPRIAPLLERLQPLLGHFDLRVQESVLPAVNRAMSALLGYTTGFLKNIFAVIIKVILMVITLFFIYRDGERFVRHLWEAFPLDREDKDIIATTVKRVMTAVIYGVFLTCLAQGTLGGIGFWFTGLPSPVLFGAMMAICALIPVVGTALVWAPGVAVLMLQGEMVMGVVLLIWGAVVIGFSDNFIRPFFISGRAQIHLLITALGGIGGLATMGLVGVVIGPLVLALFGNFFHIYVTHILPKEKEAENQPVP